MKHQYFFILCVFVLISFSCSDDDNPGNIPDNCSNNFSESFEDELAAVNAASQTYAMDPTSENCQKFKDAYGDYLDALDDWETCAIFYNQVTQWQQSIDAAQEAVDQIVC